MWMFGSRTTVKKVRNSLTWFSQICELGETSETMPLSAPQMFSSATKYFSMLSIVRFPPCQYPLLGTQEGHERLADVDA